VKASICPLSIRLPGGRVDTALMRIVIFSLLSLLTVVVVVVAAGYLYGAIKTEVTVCPVAPVLSPY